ncbi:hypothetical protein [Bacteroides faecis]|jgi:hypothetical protein|uniref:hypothetical protein n=1 Tax=Bacteroides faecis TaxID=674529 RepID=UPI0015BA2709|nr:hypothetical protein [Bacteroides faecis]MCS2576512.1 hypothetical protein [Bacteroides faecis]MCS3124700.1 hypothetical protein [Bacteroides faecis]UVQ58824.1 hypothetical protein NXY18_19370 [Bacteroides faecis]
MSDIVTRLLLKTNDFDANLNKSKKNVNGFQSDIAKMSGVAVLGVMKFAGVLGIAVTASEGFNKVMNSSQTLGDEYARTMDGLKGGVDQFFYSIGSGDWTPFMNGLSETIRLAREAYNAMDQLGNTKMSFSYFDAKNQAIVQEQITILKDKDSTEEQKKAARKLLDKTLKDQDEIVGQYKRRSNNAVQAMVKAAIGLDGVDVSGIDIDKVLKLDVSSAGDEQKAQLAKQYKDFVDEYDRLKAKFTTYETVGSGMNVHTVATTDAKALGEAISPMLAKYQDAIQYNAILVKKSDEWLQNLINVSAAAEAAGRNLSSMTKAANRASQSGTGGNPPKEKPKEGSIAWYDSEISDLNKKLIAETDMQARATIQATINELEQKKVKLKFVVDQEAFKIAHGEMKDGALPIPIKPTYDKVPTHGKNGKDFKLPKHDPLFKKEDIDLNQEYAESLANISGVVGSMSGLFDDNTASVLQWGVSFLSTVGQAIPKILEMSGVKQADTIVTNENTTAELANGASKVISAHAGIPFVGIALGLAGVAAIIAAMSSMPKYATGGIVPGTSFTGDKVPALLNSGEMILNGSQQSNLFRMLNSGLYGSLSQKITPSGNDDIRLYSDVEIKGDRIFLALHNHIKKTGKRLW